MKIKYILPLIVACIIVDLVANFAWARYIGPVEILSTTFGSGQCEMHSESDDMGEQWYPGIWHIKGDGTIVIIDGPYFYTDRISIHIFRSGRCINSYLGPKATWDLLAKVDANDHGVYLVGAYAFVKAPEAYVSKNRHNNDINIYSYAGKIISSIKYGSYKGQYVAALSNGDFVTMDKNKIYYRYSISGTLLNTLDDLPTELRPIDKEIIGELFTEKSKARLGFSVTFEDNKHVFIDLGDALLDDHKNIYVFKKAQVNRYNSCGQLVGFVEKPKDVVFQGEDSPDRDSPEVFRHEEYGGFTVDKHGNIYAWKVTPGKYSVMKWTWVDEDKLSTNCTDHKLVSDIVTYFQKKSYDGNSKLYSFADISLWSNSTGTSESRQRLIVKALRNEIFARHGRPFESLDLKQIFDSVTWYKPRKNFTESELNTFEKQNVENILQYEKKMSWK